MNTVVDLAAHRRRRALRAARRSDERAIEAWLGLGGASVAAMTVPPVLGMRLAMEASGEALAWGAAAFASCAAMWASCAVRRPDRPRPRPRLVFSRP